MIRDKALYFPYINVPRGQWLARILLYWDSLYSIVPYDYLKRPRLFSPFMRDLLKAGLVEPLAPQAHLWRIDGFGHPFVEYVAGRIESQRTGDTAERLRVHMEKLQGVGDQLVRLGVAHKLDKRWYMLDDWVAQAFMTYLATVLARDSEVDAAPITYERTAFAMLSEPAVPQSATIAEVRSMLIQHVFPRPTVPVVMHDVAVFKEKHAESLRRLRRSVESRCITVAQIADPAVRAAQAQLVGEGLDDEIQTLAEAMKIRWGKVVLGGLAVLALGPISFAVEGPKAVAAAAGLSGAIHQTVEPVVSRGDASGNPLVFAALARKRYQKDK